MPKNTRPKLATKRRQKADTPDATHPRTTPPQKLIRAAFANKTVALALRNIVSGKEIHPYTLTKNKKYAAIEASIREIGIIEPPVVFPARHGTYLLLDGHLRLEALKKIGAKTVQCLVATDDESFTYNQHVSRIANIQEHKMIERAIERGVSAEKLAKALNMDIESLRRKKNLLNGICREASDLIKSKVTNHAVFGYLKKMKPPRQKQAVELMIESNNYTRKFIQAIYEGSADDQLVAPRQHKHAKNAAHLSQLEGEFARVQREYKDIMKTRSVNALDLTLTRTFIQQLLDNEKVNRYLLKHASDIHKIWKTNLEEYSTAFESIEQGD